MKIILSIIIVLSCMYIGKQYSSNYFIRLKYLKDFKGFLEFAKLNINFNNVSVFYILENYKFESKYLNNDLTNYIQKMDNENLGNNSFLSSYLITFDEKNFIESFLKQFGQKDKEYTINLISKYIIECEKLILKISKTEKENAILPLKLSLAIGIAICILLV